MIPAPVKKTRSVTLADAEDWLAALQDTEGEVPAELQPAFYEEMQRAMKTTVEKRENVAQFILATKARGEYLRGESARMAAAARVCENIVERVKEYVIRFLEGAPKDAKGKYQKAVGLTTTMYLQGNPASLKITDESKVPDYYKRVSVDMPVAVWDALRSAAPGINEYERPQVVVTVSIDNAGVKKALIDGLEVPGAELLVGSNHLRIK